MATYSYRAKKDPQNIIEGKVLAENEKEAIEKIIQSGYIPLQVEKEQEREQFKAVSAKVTAVGRIKSKEITIFSRQLASLIRSGVPFLSAISIISEQSLNPNMKKAISQIHSMVKDGASFSSTLENYPAAFSSLYISMVRTGENSGALPEVLLKIADYRSKQEEVITRFKMAMAYPILMVIVGIGTIIFMLTYVMPRLMGLYATFNQDLPIPTKILIAISNTLRTHGLWILIAISMLALILKRETKTPAGKLFLSAFKLRIPIFGSLLLKAELARFCRTLELLIKSGIPILKAINVAIPVLQNEVISRKLRQSYKELEQGGSLGSSLKNSKLIPLLMSNLIIVGEQSGKLHEALGEVAHTYEADTDEAISVMSSLLEPIMILFLGLIVGFLVVAMLLPVFEINVM
ncbi:MAG: type II secretion system F family protein [Candidatus Omnitrophica bacterium]|nr:type II secretion system F family protein [Candidatus Omnitrophota bacterium]